MPINKSLIDAGAGIRFTGGTIAQATAVLHTNNYVYLRGGSAGLVVSNGDGGTNFRLDNTFSAWELSNSEKMRLNSTGLGIGTNSPESELHIVDSSSSTQLRLNQTGNNDALLGSGTNFFTIKTGAAGANNALNILHSNQYVGIGTTTPSEKLEVVGIIKAVHTDSTYGKYRGNGAFFNRSDVYIAPEADNSQTLNIGYNGARWGNVEINAAAVKFENGSNEFMRIDGNGQVGIGTSTPAALLDVTASTAPVIRMYRSGTGQVWTTEIDSNGRWQLREAASSGGTKYTRLQVDDPGAVYFMAYGSGSFSGTAAYNLQVNSSGQIIETAVASGTVTGSGTSTYLPIWTGSSALGNSIISSSGGDITINGSDNDPRIYINPAGGDISDTALVQFNSRGHVGYTSGLVELGDNGQSKDVRLRVNTADIIFQTSNTTRMTVKTDGKVGIGTSSPGTSLDIQGTSAQSLRVKSDDSATIIIDSDGDNSGTSGSYLHYRDTGATKWTLYKETNNDFYLHNAAASTYPIHAQAGGNILLMEDGNNLGIGAGTPAAKLDVNAGAENFVANFTSTDSIAEIRIEDSSNYTRLLTVGTQFKIMPNDGSEVLIVDGNNDRVGIGNSSPQYTLDVAGVIKGTSSIRVDAGSPYFGLYQSGSEKAYLQWVSTGTLLRLQSDGAIDYNSGGLQKWTISGSEKMTLNTDGELGINQSNPRAKLEIYNTAVTSDTDYSASETPSGQDSIILYTGGTAENTYGSISWVSGGRRRAMITAVAENADTDYQGIAFYTQGTDGSGDFYESMRIKHSGQVSFYDYRGSNNTGTPTYLLGTDANGLMVKTNSGSDLPGGPYLPLTGGTLSGPLTIQDSIASNYPALTIYNTTNGGGNNIFFSDQTGQSQKGYLTFYHGDGSSQGGGATFQFHSTETDMTLQVGSSSKAARVVVWSAGSQAEVDYGFADDINTGMTRVGADQVALVAGANQGVYVSSSSVAIKHSGSNKILTSSTGVTVTGGVTISGTNSFLIESNSTAATFNLNSGTRGFQFINNNATLLSLAGSDGYATFNAGIAATNTSFSGTMNIAGGIYHIGDTDTFFGFIGGNDTFGLTTGGGSRMDANNAGVRFGGAGARIGSVLDEDDMASNSNTSLATQQSIKAYVDNSVSGATVYKGTWDPSSGTYGNPDLSSGSLQVNGQYYICSANGSATPNGAGTEPDSWHVGDWVIWNDDLGSSGLWQKIDNTSVISGAGTAQKVVKWDGSGTSETLTNGPITFSGDNSTFAGNITMANPLTIEGGSAQIILKDTSDDDDHSILFRSNVGGDDYKITTKDFTSAGLGDGIFMGSEVAEPLGLATNDTLALTIDESQNIGIGTTAPKTKLHVMGAVGSGSAATIRVGGEGTGNNVSRLELVEHVTGNDMNYGFSFTADGNSSNDLLIKNHDNSVTGNVSISIQRGNGYVGINQSSASEPLDVSGTARMDNGIVEGTIYVGDSVQHWGDGGTGMYFNTDEVLVKTASTTALTINSSQNATFAGNVNLTDYQSGTVTTRIPRLLNVVVEPNPETKNEFVHPYLLNDLANFKARGGTITFGGLSSNPTTSLNEPFAASAKFLGVQNSVITGSTWTVTLTSTGDAAFHLNYGATVGICFGSMSFAPSSCKIEINDANDGSGTWTTVLDSNQRDTVYVAYNSTGGSGARAIRYTLGKYASYDPRITNIFAYNYSSQGMTKYFLPLEGGKIYGQLNTAGNRIINIGAPTASTDAATKAYVDSISPAGSYLPLAGGTMTGHTLHGDNVMDRYGSSNEFSIYHNGTDGVLQCEVGDLKLDVTGDILLDADGNDIRFMDNTVEYGKFKRDSGDFNIYASENNKDMKFIGQDDNSDVTALRLDMSDAGWAHFNTGIAVGNTAAISTFAGKLYVGQTSDYFGSATNIQLNSGASNKNVGIRSNILYLYSHGNGSDAALIFGDGSANFSLVSSDTDFNLYNYGTSSNSITVNRTTNDVTFAGDLLPSSDSAYNLGSSSVRWASCYFDSLSTLLTITVGGDARFQSDLTVLNKAQTSYIDIATRDTSGSEVVYNLSNIGTINGNAILTGSYLPLAGGTMTGNLLMDGKAGVGNVIGLATGTSSDTMSLKLYTYNSTDPGGGLGSGTGNIIQTDLGTNLVLRNTVTDGDIIFQSDDGSGDVITYFRLDGSIADGTYRYTKWEDYSVVSLGTGNDFQLFHDSTRSRVENNTGNLEITQKANGADILFKSDDGSGGTATYFYLDGGNTRVQFNKDARFVDSKKVMLGTGDDLQIYHDGNNSYIYDGGVGDLNIVATDLNLKAASDELYLTATSNGAVEFYYNNSKKFETTNTGVALNTGQDLAIGQYGGITIAGSYGTNGQVLKTSGSSVVWANPGSLLTAGTCIDISTNTINVDLTEASGLTDGSNVQEFIVNNTSGSTTPNKIAPANVDASQFNYRQIILTGAFYDNTNSNSTLFIPLGGSATESTSAYYYHAFVAPSAGRVKSIHMKHISGTTPTATSTRLQVWVDKSGGTPDYDSGALSSSAAYYQTISADNINTTFAENNRVFFAFKKTTGSQYWYGATVTIVVELTN